MMKWRKADGVALPKSDFANRNTRDLQGRMVSCEHGGRCVIRRWHPEDALRIEVIAGFYPGKQFNSLNDIVVRFDGTVWFTNRPCGINPDIKSYQAEGEQEGCFGGPDGTDMFITSSDVVWLVRSSRTDAAQSSNS